MLEEGGKFAAEVIAPLNLGGDAQGCTLDKSTHAVRTPDGFKDAYAQYVEGGWPAMVCDPAYGGQGLPIVVNQCVYEFLNSANQAWTMYPGLTHGAHAALHAHGTDEQKATSLQAVMAWQAMHLDNPEHMNIGRDGEIVMKSKSELKRQYRDEEEIVRVDLSH